MHCTIILSIYLNFNSVLQHELKQMAKETKLSENQEVETEQHLINIMTFPYTICAFGTDRYLKSANINYGKGEVHQPHSAVLRSRPS